MINSISSKDAARAVRVQYLKRQNNARNSTFHSNRTHSDDWIDENKENHEPASGDENSHAEDSPPILLTNPNMDLLPVVKTAQARGAFDFYVNSFVTSIIEVSPENIAPYSQIVHQVLHDELLFTAYTTCSEAARWRTQNLYDSPPDSVSNGYGKTLSLLVKRLQSQNFAMSPTILLTMGQLVAIETMIKNVSATAKHLASMQAAMQPKTQEVSKTETKPVQSAVNVWTQYFMFRAVVKASIPRTGALIYPKHPFSPKLTDKIAELPSGFSQIALSGRLSVQVLDLLQNFNSYFKTMALHIGQGIMDSPERTENILRQAAYCIEYHQIQTLGVLERLILCALTAYVVRRDRVHPAFVNVRNYFQITCAYQSRLLSSVDTGLTQEDFDSDLFTWIGLTLLLTSSPEAHGRKLALRLLPARPEPMKLLLKCQDFFWDDDLTSALLSGNVLLSKASNDVIADHIKQALPDARQEMAEEED